MNTINLQTAKNKRLLTKEEEIQIASWMRENPDIPMTEQIKVWMKDFNCSGMSINQVIVKMGMGIL